MEINKIIIKERIRKDLGDLSLLKESMEKYGLISPIIVNHKNILIAGERRLRAAQELGWEEIDVIVKDYNISDMIALELEENTTRKEFTCQELTQGTQKHIKSLKKNMFIKLWDFIKKIFSRSK